MQELSDVGHRIKLQALCNSYRQLIFKISSGKEHFLVDLVKSLRKITNEWKSWNHVSYGRIQTKVFVSAIEQVRELLLWGRRAYNGTTASNNRSNSVENIRQFTLETLYTFLNTCNELEKLRIIFHSQILTQLKQHMNNDKETERYVMRLELILMHWNLLLSPGTISVNHYSMGSDVLLKHVEMQDGFNNFYPVLRLIPDLCFKAELCMEYAKHCLHRGSLRGYKRERNFLLNVWLPKRKQLEKNKLVIRDTSHSKTDIDFQVSSELLKVLEKQVKETNKTLNILIEDRNRSHSELKEIVDNQKISKNMLEPLALKDDSLAQQMEHVVFKRTHVSKRIFKRKKILQKMNLIADKQTELNEQRNLLTQEINQSTKLSEQLEEWRRELDETRMKSEAMKNKIATQNWFIRKKTKKINEISDEITTVTKQRNDLQIEYKTINIKQKINKNKR